MAKRSHSSFISDSDSDGENVHALKLAAVAGATKPAAHPIIPAGTRKLSPEPSVNLSELMHELKTKESNFDDNEAMRGARLDEARRAVEELEKKEREIHSKLRQRRWLWKCVDKLERGCRKEGSGSLNALAELITGYAVRDILQRRQESNHTKGK
ncbi:hypothetical protein L207DRAFT_638563 [Hyaloscypha variabilis F]|uniref:Uncharacterized protein n=1 Tax=Hyaloscypha variabilis (strain UAMH 11265 / GT02V1 / F) TaxID=1149755 RepID=A0A2J6R640_HYAVF|nr:hypothetical protein L207DRAFT_638563 [Hyaloscypha variabilis F]